MPKLNGEPTRAEKRAANKRANALAMREQEKIGRTIPPGAFEHRPKSDAAEDDLGVRVAPPSG